MYDFEQIDFFDLLDTFDLTSKEKGFFKDERVIKVLSDENLNSYLQREEKILSIAREKIKKLDAILKMSDLERKLYSISYKTSDGLHDILQKMSRIMRRYIEDLEINPGKIEDLKSLIDVPAEIEIVDSGAISCGIYQKLSKTYSGKLLKVTVKEAGYPDMAIYGSIQHSHNARYQNALFYETEYAIADMGLLFSYMTVLKKVNETMINQQELVESKCRDIVSENTRWVFFSTLLEKKHIALEEFMKHPVFEMERPDFFLEERLMQYFPHADFYYERKHRKNALYLNKEQIEWLIRDCFPYEYSMQYSASYHLLLEKSRTGVFWPLPHKNIISYYAQFITEVWKKVSEIQGSLERQLSGYKESRTQYARSYQTKKNIPQKILAAMAGSVLNRYFGYVEYDESVSLEKVAEIENEFIAFKETYFPEIDASENAIRFRKLGKQKAAGLYYPALQCLCVDINNPSSFIHEFGHLIDYTYENLSIQNKFLPIVSLYSDELRSAMYADENIKKVMKGNTKYNFNYYTTPTEVFARCYEMYCKKELNVANSLIDASGIAYPDSAELDKKIKEYFDSLFKKEEKAA